MNPIMHALGPWMAAISAVLACVWACSASNTGGQLPRTGSEPVVLDAGPSPTADAAPALVERPDASPDAMPRVLGWFCLEARNYTGATDYMSICTKSRLSCEDFYQQGKAQGDVMAECVRRDIAHCFLLQIPVDEYQELMCTDTEVQCQRKRKWLLKRKKQFKHIPECSRRD